MQPLGMIIRVGLWAPTGLVRNRTQTADPLLREGNSTHGMPPSTKRCSLTGKKRPGVGVGGAA